MKNKNKTEQPIRERVLKRGEEDTLQAAGHRATEKRKSSRADESEHRMNHHRGYYSRNGGHAGYNGL